MKVFGLIWLVFSVWCFYIMRKNEKESARNEIAHGVVEKIKDIHTYDNKEYATVFVRIDEPDKQLTLRKEEVEITNISKGQDVYVKFNMNQPNDYIFVKKAEESAVRKGLSFVPNLILGVFILIGILLFFSDTLGNAFRGIGFTPFAFVPLLFGLIFFAIGYGMRYFEKRKNKRCSVEVEGSITDLVSREHETEDGVSKLFHPVVSYRYLDVDYQNESNVGQRPSPYALGEILTVFINPTDPNDFILPKDDLARNKIETLFIIFGGLWAAIGVIVLAMFLIAR